MQLFFGDMEYYTICATFILLYILTAILFIQKKATLILPACTLMAAMTMHMASAFLLPSLAYLFIVELDRHNYASLFASVLAFTGILSFSLLVFLSLGASLNRLVETSWGLGRGGNVLENIARFSPVNFWGRVNLIGLLFPSAYILLPFVTIKKAKKEHIDMFLIISAVCGLLFFFSWRSTIGLYMDWNLFALPLIPLIILFTSNFSDVITFHNQSTIIYLISISYLLSYSWIFSNHALQ
jgi:hypothetical protein